VLSFAGHLPLHLVAQAQSESLWELFQRSGPIAKIIFTVLGTFSLASWAVMIGKMVQMRRASQATDRFLKLFRESKRFSEVSAASAKLTASPLVGLFQSGYAEIDAQVRSQHEAQGGEAQRYRIRSLSGVERSLTRAIGVELLGLSRGVPFLATTASATPFIGLFGTVWGILIAFRDIGLSGSTSIVAVAPGIAEALINTAAGLGAAIPALIGFNHFATRLRRLRAEMDDFVLEFLNLAERNFT
jgi:biopolymer transport protein TolQ